MYLDILSSKTTLLHKFLWGLKFDKVNKGDEHIIRKHITKEDKHIITFNHTVALLSSIQLFMLTLVWIVFLISNTTRFLFNTLLILCCVYHTTGISLAL